MSPTFGREKQDPRPRHRADQPHAIFVARKVEVNQRTNDPQRRDEKQVATNDLFSSRFQLWPDAGPTVQCVLAKMSPGAAVTSLVRSNTRLTGGCRRDGLRLVHHLVAKLHAAGFFGEAGDLRRPSPPSRVRKTQVLGSFPQV